MLQTSQVHLRATMFSLDDILLKGDKLDEFVSFNSMWSDVDVRLKWLIYHKLDI